MVQVPLDTPVEVRAEKFRGLLDNVEAGSYRLLQESTEEFPVAEVPPLRRSRLTEKGKSLVAVARGHGRGGAVRLAAGLLGGAQRIMDSVQPVLLKPNFNSAGPFPASTHKDLLQALVELCREAGCGEIDIGEMGGLLSPGTEKLRALGNAGIPGQKRHRRGLF